MDPWRLVFIEGSIECEKVLRRFRIDVCVNVFLSLWEGLLGISECHSGRVLARCMSQATSAACQFIYVLLWRMSSACVRLMVCGEKRVQHCCPKLYSIIPSHLEWTKLCMPHNAPASHQVIRPAVPHTMSSRVLGMSRILGGDLQASGAYYNRRRLVGTPAAVCLSDSLWACVWARGWYHIQG